MYVVDSNPKGAGNLVKLTDSPAGSLSMVPAWSPDAKRVAFESDRGDASGSGYTAIYVMDAAAPGSAATRLTFSQQNDIGGWRLAAVLVVWRGCFLDVGQGGMVGIRGFRG